MRRLKAKPRGVSRFRLHDYLKRYQFLITRPEFRERSIIGVRFVQMYRARLDDVRAIQS